MKKADALRLMVEYHNSHAPKAQGKRRVSLRLLMAKGKRCPDRDAYWKSLLDGLVHAGMLVDDNPKHCELGGVEFERSNNASFGTMITLEDV